jgi:hypothetical protein
MLLTAHTAGMILLAARRQWINRIRPESVQGSDRHMMRWCIDNHKRAYAFFSVSFGFEDDDSFARAIETIRADLTEALADPRASFRRGISLEQEHYIWRDDLVIDDLVEVVDSDEQFFRIDDDRQREMVIRLHTGRRRLGYLFDHTVWDGIRVVNECLVPAIRCKPFDSKWLAEDTYTPGLSELLMIYTGYRTGIRALTHRPLPLLEDDHAQHVVQHIWNTADVKALKNRLKVSFSAAIVAMYGKQVLDWLPEDRSCLRLGIIIGFKNDRFRNNYSIISVDVMRNQDLEQTTRSVGKQLKQRRLEVVGLYQLGNLLEVETFFKSHLVDVLFSPAFFERGEGLSQRVDDMSFYNVPCSTPLYSFACSIGDTITISTTNNCPLIDMKKLTRDAVGVFHYAPSGSLCDVSDQFDS